MDQSGSGAAAAELTGLGGPAAGSVGLMDNRNQEDHSTTGCDQENEKQPCNGGFGKCEACAGTVVLC